MLRRHDWSPCSADMSNGSDGYLKKSPDAGRMGKAAELLVAATCILQSRARLNVSTSIIDDEGVDIVFHLREHTATLAVQVKAQMSDGALVQKKRFQAQVREASFNRRDDLDMLFVYNNVTTGSVEQTWLVPSHDFAANTSVTTRGLRRFVASMSADSNDKWSQFKIPKGTLAEAVVGRLESSEI